LLPSAAPCGSTIQQGVSSQSRSTHHSATGNSRACASHLPMGHDAIHNPVSRLLIASSQRDFPRDDYLLSRLLKSSRSTLR
jgi:hypothetical protein